MSIAVIQVKVTWLELQYEAPSYVIKVCQSLSTAFCHLSFQSSPVVNTFWQNFICQAWLLVLGSICDEIVDHHPHHQLGQLPVLKVR